MPASHKVASRHWKSADVIPAPKISNPKSVDSDLRPISLTSVLSKLLESFVFRWLFGYIKPSIDPLQFGNMKNCSTTHALIHMIHNWLAELENPGSTIRCCMIHFSKAFDRIDHNILLHKLQQLNIPPILLNLRACMTDIYVSNLARINQHGDK